MKLFYDKEDQKPQAPHSHVECTDWGFKSISFGYEILAKRDFFGSVKDAWTFLGHEKNTGVFWGNVFFISSNQQQHKHNKIYCWCGIFLGVLKKVGIFWGR